MPADTEIKARPTLYKGIQMRSRLEADFAGWLDQTGHPWDYEPTCFAADGIQWLPDFRITFGLLEGRTSRQYVEVKPAALMNAFGSMSEFIAQVDGILCQMSVAWDSEPDASLMLAFHEYGCPWSTFEVYGYPGQPWRCVDNRTPNPMFLIWHGMGQAEALPKADESARERRQAHAR